MNQTLVDRIANAVLYEGYILYPYRPSVKNRQRWTFGGLYPPAYSSAQGGSDAWTMQTECLVRGGRDTALAVKVRFLHLVARTVGELYDTPSKVAHKPDAPAKDRPSLARQACGPDAEPSFRAVETLQVGDRLFHSWQEAVEREVAPADADLAELAARPRQEEFAFPASRHWEPLPCLTGEVAGVMVRQQQPVRGSVQLSAEHVEDGLFKVTVKVLNQTPLEGAAGKSRDEALMQALVSTHTILGVREGEFVSLLDPPEGWREIAAGCRNVGTWPVLVGEAREKDTMLSSPIILYDYPQIAPESPGDLFDATEIDEVLTMRILTLTEEEKRAMAAVDERGRALLDRTEALAREQLMGLHGTVRGLRPLPKGENHE